MLHLNKYTLTYFQDVKASKRVGPMMLIVAPTRELAMQSQKVLEEASTSVKIRRNGLIFIIISNL